MGGSVRDLILWPDRVPKDIDIATNASLNDIRKLLPHTHAIGKAFGVGLCESAGHAFEIATFRKEADYSDRRHPSHVSPGTIEEDSVRRDFTINALYFDPIANVILDFHHGIDDLRLRRLQCVGDPAARLHEDPLRILRLFRFAANLQFSIAEQTQRMAESLCSELVHVSLERVLLEVSKLSPTALAAFSQHLKKFQDILLGQSERHGVNESDPITMHNPAEFSLPAASLHFPATVFALMCIHNEGFLKRDWCKAFSRWPFSLAERDQLELAVRVAGGGFSLTPKLLSQPEPEQWQTAFESLKWLSRQNRILKTDAQWIADFVQKHRPENSFIAAFCQLHPQDSLHNGIADAIEKTVADRAKPLRSQLHLKLDGEPPQALGWARLLLDWAILFQDMNNQLATLPAFMDMESKTFVDDLIAAAKILMEKNNSKKNSGRSKEGTS
ncbi:MAG: hypothetical protein RIR26_2550 [Pseudomonadota bacterium]